MKFIEVFEILKSAQVMEKLNVDPLKEIYAYRKDYGKNREENCMQTENKSEIQPFVVKFNKYNTLSAYTPQKFPIHLNNCNTIIIQETFNYIIKFDIFEHDDWELITREEIMKNNFLW